MWLEVVERESGRDGSRESERESFVLLQTLDALAPRTTNRRSANRQRVSTVKDALAGALVGALVGKAVIWSILTAEQTLVEKIHKV